MARWTPRGLAAGNIANRIARSDSEVTRISVLKIPLLAESSLLHCTMATSASRLKADVSGSER
jgi:hypothetical protein